LYRKRIGYTAYCNICGISYHKYLPRLSDVLGSIMRNTYYYFLPTLLAYIIVNYLNENINKIACQRME